MSESMYTNHINSHSFTEERMRVLNYSKGTLYFSDDFSIGEESKYFSFNKELSRYEAPAYMYKDIMLYTSRNGTGFLDQAKDYNKDTSIELKEKIIPRSFQNLALEAWKKNNYLGVVSLPTGAGKTIVAVLGIDILVKEEQFTKA